MVISLFNVINDNLTHNDKKIHYLKNTKCWFFFALHIADNNWLLNFLDYTVLLRGDIRVNPGPVLCLSCKNRAK